MSESQPDWIEYQSEGAVWTCSPSELETLAADISEPDWTYPPDSGTRSAYSLRDASQPVVIED